MSPEAVLDIGMECILVAAKLAAPILITALVVGFGISLLQSITQVQEVTLSFVPKIVAVAIALVVAGNWMIAEIIAFTNDMFDRIPMLLSGG
jgi:flagellar biosynthetic protein FliQ